MVPTRTSAIRVLAEALPTMISAMVGQPKDPAIPPLGGITKQVAEHLKAEVCSIWLLDDTGENLILREAHGYQPQAINQKHSLNKGLTGKIVTEKAEFLLNWSVQDPDLGWAGLFDKELQSHCWSLLGVPIISSKTGKTLGALKLENKQKEWGTKAIGQYLLSVSQRVCTPKIIREEITQLARNVVKFAANSQFPGLAERLESLVRLAEGIDQAAGDMRFIGKSAQPGTESQKPNNEQQEETVVGHEHVKTALDSMRWHLGAVHAELEHLRQLAVGTDFFHGVSQTTHALRQALETYDPFTSEDLFLARAMAAMIAAALDIDRTAYMQGWERITHSLNHVTADFLDHFDNVTAHITGVRQVNKDEFLKSLTFAYRSAIYLDGTRELFQKRGATEGEKVARSWPAGFIALQVDSRSDFYRQLGNLYGYKVAFDADLKNTNRVYYECIVAHFLGALDVIVDNAFRYGASNIRIHLYERDQFLILEIRDNGPGLPENFEIQRGVRYVMQPSGGGMGLYNARQALKAFDGILSHENGVPGALFRIALQQSTKKTNQNLELRPE
jgi:hypothetical protein